jgi:gluconolactonase
LTLNRIRDSNQGDLISADAELELLGSGFEFTEGPAWSTGGQFLIFSDIPGDQMWRWDEEVGFESHRNPSCMANGNTFDREGRLVTCEHATSRVTRVEADGSTSVLASGASLI